MPRRSRPEWYRRPEIVLADLLSRAARDEIPEDDHQILRALVLAVDPDGGVLENKDGTGSYGARGTDGRRMSLTAGIGPANPAGSVKARILTDGLDRLRADQDLRVFWPLHPQDQLAIPISPGEHVYVMFEGRRLEHGLWISRVSGHESAGSFMGSDSYTAPSAASSAMDSFEPNQPQYSRDDASASMAPAKDAMGTFEGED